MLRRPPDWTEHAACVGLATADDDPWTPTGRRQELQFARARIVCSTCPVRLACARHGLGMLSVDQAHSMYGGLTPTELRAVARRLGMSWQPVAQHGSRSRYVAGCADGPDGEPCADCKMAHREYEQQRRERVRDGRGGHRDGDALEVWRVLEAQGDSSVSLARLLRLTAWHRPRLQAALDQLVEAGVAVWVTEHRQRSRAVIELLPPDTTAATRPTGEGRAAA